MTDETGSPAGIEAIALPADAPETFDSPSAAAEYFSGVRAKPPKEPTAESADKAATAEPELPDRASDHDNDPPETDQVEEPEAAEPDDNPPIEPPRSWTKEEKEEFKSYPRDAQEKIAKAATRYEAEFRRSQNEIAETRKAVEAQKEIAEKVRQQYEAQLPALLQELQNAQQNAFADIKNVDDVTKLANEDPFRYLQWQAHQTKLQAVNAENERARAYQTQKEQADWAELVQKENLLAAEFIPELADKEKGDALTKRVANELLPELGFKPDELNALASGKARLPIYDHRVQRLFADSLKLRDIQSAPKAVAKPNLPPVQRPGTSKPQGSGTSERIQALNRKPELSESEATELYTLQQRSSRRAS